MYFLPPAKLIFLQQESWQFWKLYNNSLHSGLTDMSGICYGAFWLNLQGSRGQTFQTTCSLGRKRSSKFKMQFTELKLLFHM